MADPSPMNAGEGKHSYAKNSSFQKSRLDATKGAIKEAIFKSFDAVDDKQETSAAANSSFMLRIADLGCSTGPNTFFAMQAIVEAITSKYSNGSQELEFQVFFNDVTSNDFNTLFASLPKYWNRQHYAAGVAGSFYDRLFPSSSIHVFNCFFALHWLSKVPEDLLIRDSPAWNGGKIHYAGASEAVFNAYESQLEKDVDAFLKARAEEIVSGGIVMICCPGRVDGTTNTAITGVMYIFFGSVLLEMVQEGLIEQDQVDTFNLPAMQHSVKQMTRLVEKNGCFSIEKMELRNVSANSKLDSGFLELLIMHFRAAGEGTFIHHFGNETVNEMFERAFQRKQKLSELLENLKTEGGDELFAVLKRK